MKTQLDSIQDELEVLKKKEEKEGQLDKSSTNRRKHLLDQEVETRMQTNNKTMERICISFKR